MPDTYYDELYIQVGLIDRPHWEKDAKCLDVLVALPSGSANVNDVVAEVEAIAQGRSHIFRSSSRHVDWGADASWLSFGIDVGVGLGINTVYDSIKALIKKFRGAQGFRDGHICTDDELVERAARLLAQYGGFHYDELKATGIERPSDPAIATVHYVRNGTDKLDVTIRMIEGIPVVERKYRDLP